MPVEGSINTDESGDLYYVRVHGSLDSATIKAVQQRVEESFMLKYRAVLLDLNDIGHLSSHGLRLLLSTRSKCRVQGVHFAIFSHVPIINKVIDLTGCREELGFFSSEEEALKSCL